MTKGFMGFGLFAILILVFTSCSRLLRPTSGVSKKQNGNIKKDTVANNGGGQKASANTQGFTGTLLSNIIYTTAINYKGEEQQLAVDVYIPPNAEGKKFPTIFLVHGGSFTGGDKTNIASTCSKIANNGYVVISVNYRVGWGFVSRTTSSCSDTILLKQAMYRAVQDLHTAMRYVAAHADDYNVDKNWFFVGGQSAGAITALTTAYLQDKDSSSFFPGFSEKFGLLDKAANDPGSTYTLKGVISMWGAFIDPQLITAQRALPTIFFQGKLDKAVPFNSGAFVPCSSASIVYGTNPLYKRLKALGETAIAHVDPQGGHGVFEEEFRVNNILCFLNNVRQGTKKQVYLTGVQNSCGK